MKGQKVELKRQTEGGGGERGDKTQNSRGEMEGELQVSYSCLFLMAKPTAWIRLTESSDCFCISRNSSTFHWQKALVCLCAGTAKAEVG